MISAPLFRTLLLFGGVIASLYFASSVIMPIIFSGVCAFFIYPAVKKLESIGLPLALSSFLVVFFCLAFGAGLTTFVVFEGSEIVQELPTKGLEEVVDNPVSAVDDKVNVNLSKYHSEIQKGIAKMGEKLMAFIPETIINLNRVLIFLITCPVYTFFMLIARKSIIDFYYSSFSEESQGLAKKIVEETQDSYSSYLKGLVLVMAIVGVLTSVGLLALGIKYALFLGVLAGLLTILPYLGVILSATLPIIIALLTKDSIWYSVGVILTFVIVQFLEGNFITPKIMGNQVDINPLAVILGIVILGALGGITGMILTIPLLALFKIVANHIPSWKPIYNLLST
jgi:predicted PurR-regulated permease PerM